MSTPTLHVLWMESNAASEVFLQALASREATCHYGIESCANMDDSSSAIKAREAATFYPSLEVERCTTYVL